MKKPKNWPSKAQWRQFFKVLSKKERITFSVFAVLFLSSLIFLVSSFYAKHTEVQPTQAGSFTEGIVGHPRFINPIYSEVSDPDRDLTELIFSGLMKYNKNGEIVPDLAEDYKIQDQGRIYEFYLKENIRWQDGKPLTIDDIIFTIETVQNPEYNSPLRSNWLDVETIKISDTILRLELKASYFPFLENCTLKIIPKHIWENIPSENFPLSFYNLKPIGSGPYRLEKLKQTKTGYIESITLVLNPYYFDKKPYLEKIKLLFFNKEEDLIKAAKRKNIEGLSLLKYENLGSGWETYHFPLLRYFSVFFNLEKSKLLAQKEIREALSYAINKEELIEMFSKEKQAEIINSPILPSLYNFELPSEIYSFNPEKASEILETAGYKLNSEGKREKIINKEPSFKIKSDLQYKSKGLEVKELQRCLAGLGNNIYPEKEVTGYFGKKTEAAVIRFQETYKKDILDPWNFTKGTGIVSRTTRAKLNELCFSPNQETKTLKFSLATVNQPALKEVAYALQKQWEKLGIEVEIQAFDLSDLEKEIIKPRNYEALLFGEALKLIADPFPFWHSSQKYNPGLNLSLYENKKADDYLEKARKSNTPEEHEEQLINFQEVITNDIPAIFLFSLDYLYFARSKIKGIEPALIIDPSKRFSDISNWHLKTKRIWK